VSLTAKDVAEIARLLEDSNFDELDLEIDGFKIHLKRQGAGAAVSAVANEPARTSDGSDRRAPAPAAQPPVAGVHEVRAPLLGTFYRAPKPGAPPYVEVGARVDADTIIGIIEVMKLMTPLRAGVAGTVCEILVRDGALVEYGETLLRVAGA